MTVAIDYHGDDPNFLVTALRSETGFDELVFGVEGIRLVNRDNGLETEFFTTDPVFDVDGELVSLSLSGAEVRDADGLVARVDLDPVLPFLSTIAAIEAYISGDITPLQEVFGNGVVYDGAVARGPILMDAALFSGALGPIELTGTRFDDLLVGTLGNDRIAPGAGVDTILATRGNDTIDFGGAARAILSYADTEQRAAATGASVLIDLASGTGRVAAPGGADTLREIGVPPMSGADGLTVIGSGGRDDFETIGGAPGRIHLAGGAGDDLFVLQPSSVGEVIRLIYDTDGRTGPERGIVANYDTGEVSEDGYGGRDVVSLALDVPEFVFEIRGTPFADRVVGGGADNLFQMLGGSDTLDGGDGLDTVDYESDSTSSGVTVNLARGTALGASSGEAFTDSLTGIEAAIGTRFRDNLAGDDGANLLMGGDARDDLSGGGGDDTLYGGDGADRLDGGPGADALHGGGDEQDIYIFDDPGDHIIDPGPSDRDRIESTVDLDLAALAFEGSVILRGTEALRVHGDAQFGNGIIGNAGDNVFIERGGRDTLIGGDGDDVFAFVRDARSWALIEDFEAGDRIALDDSFFGLGDRGVDVRDVTPDQVSAAIRSGKALYDRQTGDLSYDHDGRAGPGDSALIATIMGAPTLAADDLLLF